MLPHTGCQNAFLDFSESEFPHFQLEFFFIPISGDFALFCGLSGCEECNIANPSVCLKHGPLHPIPNRPVMSKARASLPLVLYIDRFLGGVFSKRRIPKRTQFGPVEGPLVPQSELQDHYIHLKVSNRCTPLAFTIFIYLHFPALFYGRKN